MEEERERPRGGGGIGEGVRTGIGILTAFKDAIEETIQEAVSRGDLSPDRARETVRSAASRLQEGLEGTRERLDFVPRRDFDDLRTELATLRAEVAELRTRLQSHEGRPEHAAGGAALPVAEGTDAGMGDTAELAAEARTLTDSPGGFPVDEGS